MVYLVDIAIHTFNNQGQAYKWIWVLDTLSGVPCIGLLHPLGRERSCTLRFVMPEEGDVSSAFMDFSVEIHDRHLHILQ